jgi:hypothetical protein
MAARGSTVDVWRDRAWHHHSVSIMTLAGSLGDGLLAKMVAGAGHPAKRADWNQVWGVGQGRYGPTRD